MCATVGKALGKHWTIECQCIKQQRFWRTLFMKYKSTCSTNGKAWSRINGAPFFILFHHPSTPTQRQCIYCTPHLESIGFLPVSLWILLSVLDRLFCASSKDRCSIRNSAAIFCHYHAVLVRWHDFAPSVTWGASHRSAWRNYIVWLMSTSRLSTCSNVRCMLRPRHFWSWLNFVSNKWVTMA